MISIIGGDLYQWDVGRSVKFQDNGLAATELHFANKGDSKAVKMKIDAEGTHIPDYLLCTGKQLCVYAVNDGITVEFCIFPVTKRERPENYVYEDDKRNYIYELIQSAEDAAAEAERVIKELKTARDNGEFNGPKGEKGEDAPQDAVLYNAQALTDEQKAQARANIGAAAVGEAGGGSADAVLYTTQTLTTAQQRQARDNIGATDLSTAMQEAERMVGDLMFGRSLSEEAKVDARETIGAASAEEIGDIETALDNIIAIQNSLIGGDGA